jgi:catalase
MLQARLVSYPDAHRYRIGTNYEALPVNKPKCPINNYNRDGAMRFDGNLGSETNYESNSSVVPRKTGATGRGRFRCLANQADRYDHRAGNDDYTQPGNLYRLLDEGAKNRLCENIAGSLGQTPQRIQELQLSHFRKADPDYGARVEKLLKQHEHPKYIHEPDAAESAVALPEKSSHSSIYPERQPDYWGCLSSFRLRSPRRGVPPVPQIPPLRSPGFPIGARV